MKLLVGLGNPGPKYEQTRHNIGFQILDEVSKGFKIPLREKKFQGGVSVLWGKGKAGSKGEEVLLCCPLTYMNESGRGVVEVLNFYRLT
ncbi:MAG: aminoacyl-tRNA hydrolase, partial [bacterium]|nr:aminoacyl-tRNA hydrolase [bacterium]